jgi:hypothetical protein
MKEIKPDIDPEKRIGNSERPAVTKAEVGIPFGVETSRKEQSDASADQDNGQLKKPGRKIDTGLRARIGSGQKGRLPRQTVSAESGTISGSLMEIDPQVQKGENESRAKHRPLNRQKRPEDAGVVELPHPQPFLCVPGDFYQNNDEYDRSNNYESQ